MDDETNNGSHDVCCHSSPNVHDHIGIAFDVLVGRTPIAQ